jgi:hypothetical protein
MSIGTILLIVLILILIGAIPVWPHSRGWGYGPSGGLGLLVVILIVLLIMGLICRGLPPRAMTATVTALQPADATL